VAELDAAVWEHVRGLLDDPATLLAQFEAAAHPAGEPAEDRTEVQLRRLDREERRLLDAYQAEAIDLAELKARRQQIEARRRALVAGREQQARLRAEREAAGRVYHDLAAFCARLRARLDGASVEERQRVLQLVVERVIVGADTLEVRHVIPLRPPGPGPQPAGGPPARPEPRGEHPDSGQAVDGRTDDPARIRLRSLCVTAARHRLRAAY
jgi:site-specific DNA recombinase